MRRVPNYRHEGFKKVSEYYYDEILRLYPVTATCLGEHKYDDLLPVVGVEAIEKEISFLKAMRDSFQALPERELTLDERLDRQIVMQICQTQLFMLEDVKRWRLGVDLAENIGSSIFTLYIREFASLPERLESIIARLRAVPVYLMNGRTLFQNVPQLWGEMFMETAERLPELFATIEQNINGRVPNAVFNEFQKSAKEAQSALLKHSHWLKNAVMPNAKGDWAMGMGSFNALMAIRRLGLSNNEILEIGEGRLRQAREKIDNYAKKMVGAGQSFKARREEAHTRVKSNAPKSFEHALEAYRDAVARSRAFVETSEFATLPTDEHLIVMETPSYMAQVIPFAAYLTPEKNSKPQKGIYLVTRNSANDAGSHNYSDISNTSIHEGYPGHHLQLSAQNLHPSKFRVLSDSIELVEGWAHYCEEEAKKLGFETGDENYFVQGIDEAWRAARILIDVKIHTKVWSYEQGLQCLLENTNMEQSSAMAEMKRYTQSPSYPLSYMVGKHLIYDLKNSLKNEFGSDFKDKLFHDLIIYEGSLPIFLGKEFYPRMMRENLKNSMVFENR